MELEHKKVNVDEECKYGDRDAQKGMVTIGIINVTVKTKELFCSFALNFYIIYEFV